MIISLYSDGGMIGLNPSPIGGTYAWCTVDEHDELVTRGRGVIVPEPGFTTTNNIAEYYALLSGLESLDDGWSGTVYCDSLITLGRFFGTFKNKNISTSYVQRKESVIQRLGVIVPVHLSGHPTKKDLAQGYSAKSGRPVSKWNEYCDEQCRIAGEKYMKALGNAKR